MEKHGPDVPGSRNYICNICGTRLKNEISLKAHIKLSHEMPEETCKVCEKKFKNKQSNQQSVKTKSKKVIFQQGSFFIIREAQDEKEDCRLQLLETKHLPPG